MIRPRIGGSEPTRSGGSEKRHREQRIDDETDACCNECGKLLVNIIIGIAAIALISACAIYALPGRVAAVVNMIVITGGGGLLLAYGLFSFGLLFFIYVLAVCISGGRGK